jgi:hypothetical protein
MTHPRTEGAARVEAPMCACAGVLGCVCTWCLSDLVQGGLGGGGGEGRGRQHGHCGMPWSVGQCE